MMLNTFRLIALAALLAVAAPLAAQDTETTETEATETEAPETSPEGATVPSDLDMGTPVEGGEPRVGEAYVRQEFGDWAMRCLQAPEGQPDPCQLYQLLMDEDDNPVAEISMFPLPPGNPAAAGATIVAPLETMLGEQITLTVDGSASRRYPFTFCNRAGCVARVGFTEEEVEQFRRGVRAEMSIVPAAAPDERVTLQISLNGFTAGFGETETPPIDEE